MYMAMTGGFPSQRASNAEMRPFDDVNIWYLVVHDNQKWQNGLP